MPPVPQRTPARRYGRQRAAQVDRSNQALELWLYGGATHSEVARAMGISVSRAGQLIRAALQRQMRMHDALAHTVLQQELQRTQVVLSEAYDIVLRDCPRCHGHGLRNSNVCGQCAGTGYWHDVETRRKWMDTLLRAGEQRARLLGLHDPTLRLQMLDKSGQPTDPQRTGFQELLLGMPPEELDEVITDFLAANDAARAAGEAAPDTTPTQPPTAAVEPTPKEDDGSYFDNP
jgi:hypothetical protein